MNRYRLASKAKADLRQIWSFIALDSIEAADRVEGAILDACAFLSTAPLSGHVRSDLTVLPLRFWSVVRFPKYVIIYNPATRPLQVIRIIHGARNLRRLLHS